LKNATFIYNPVAGRQAGKRERQIREAAVALEVQGIAAKIVPTTGPNTASGLARTAFNQGDELILVCGGDGTINEVINGLAETRATLGILPGGTANIFAKELGLPHHPVKAARALGQWIPRRIALGRATSAKVGDGPSESRFFLSLAGVGFDAYIVHKLTWDFKRGWGVAAYVWEAIRQALRYPYPPFWCRMNGIELPATFAVVQRTTRYAGWLRLAPAADLFAPRFETCVFKSRSWLRYFYYAAAVVMRQHSRLSDFKSVSAQKVECTAASPGDRIYFELDGEIAGQLPATFEIIPDALTILVPSEKTRSR
jgi:YegS/Rv2252/BmrU family lipid kinase